MDGDKGIAAIAVYILALIQGMMINYMIYMPKVDVGENSSASLFAMFLLLSTFITVLFACLFSYLSD